MTACLCILSKSMLTNFCTDSIFVKVLRRYDTDYSKQHIGLFEGHINTKKSGSAIFFPFVFCNFCGRRGGGPSEATGRGLLSGGACRGGRKN